MNAIFGKQRTGNRDRQDGTGKHLNFLATNVKHKILKSLFIHLHLAKRLNPFSYKKLKKKLAECMCLELKIQEMHIMVSPLNRRQPRWCCFPICLPLTFPAQRKISVAFQAHLNFIMGKQTYKQLSQIRIMAKNTAALKPAFSFKTINT